MATSNLLLRLFESEHFTLQLALTYLGVYSEQIGVTHYLVGRLTRFPHSEIEFYWPQLCHLLVTSVTESSALENFVIQKCHESTHLAMLTMWYMQASLSDLSATPNASSFKTCRSVFNRVQSIIFADSAALTSSGNLSNQTEKIQPHTLTTLVGIGILAAAIGRPALAETSGQIVIQQGRRRRSDDLTRDIVNGQEGEPRASSSGESDEESKPKSQPLQSIETPRKSRKLPAPLDRSSVGTSSPPVSRSATFTPSQMAREPSSRSVSNPQRHVPNLQKQNHLSQSTSVANLNTPPSPQIQRKNTRRIGSIAIPSHAASSPELTSPTRHSASVPSLPLRQSEAASSVVSFSKSSTGQNANAPLDVQKAVASLPKELLVEMLRSHACRAQLDLLNSLQDISTRLINVPKMARLSALRAELTVLNHGLPRGCCLGMDCRGPVLDSETSADTKAKSCSRHNRIVRISPSETVVLNSADRAPFLMHVEVLEGDLDFDPSRRQNAEDLRAIMIEREEALAKASLRNRPQTFSTPGKSIVKKTKLDKANGSTRPRPENSPRPASTPTKLRTELPKTPETSKVAQEDDAMQEVDMVEQMFGDLGISPEIPKNDFSALVHNRSVDEEAWQRHQRRSNSLSRGSMPPTADAQKSPLKSGAAPPSNRKAMTMSIDEYAERMRMAAIMLSQLNANQQTPMGMVQATSGAASGIVGVGMGIGAGIGGAVGFGLGAVRDALPFYGAQNKAGQGSIGLQAKVNTDSAATGLSDVQGSPIAYTSAAPRPKVLLPSEASAIRSRIMAEMMALEEERMDRMRADSKARASGWTSGAPSSSFGGNATEDSSVVLNAVQKEDPSAAMFSESWADKAARIRSTSPYGHLANWNVFSVIIKTGADLRQEQLATQLIREFGRIWGEARCQHWVRYFRILVTSESTGLIETITDTMSIHSIKKNAYARRASTIADTPTPLSYSLYDHFVEKFGDPDSAGFRRAQDNFMKSLASYSVICFLLQIKDRHNGNILIDTEGHIMHIDFGFLLSNSPGQLGFEMAPFKMPQDYIDILGGFASDKYADFRRLLRLSFFQVRQQAERIIMIVDLMQKGVSVFPFSTDEPAPPGTLPAQPVAKAMR